MNSRTFNITPKESQIEHINAIIKHLDNYHGYIESSPTGSGKTYVTSYIANKLGLAMMVICPNQVKHTWDKIRNVQGAFIPILATQGEIRGSNINQVNKNFPFLKRHDSSRISRDNVVSYTPTEEFIKILDAGVLLVIDEVSLMKNEESQITTAVMTLVQTLVSRPETKSRYVLMSALMVDSVEQALTFATLTGWTNGNISDRNELFNLLKMFLYMDHDTTMQVLENYNYLHGLDTKDQLQYLVYDLMRYVAMTKYAFKLPEPNVESDRFISYFNMTDDEYERYRAAVENLTKYVVYDDNTNESKGAELKDSGRLMKEIEMSKTGVIIRETMKILEEQPTSKIIIMIDSLETIQYIHNAFLYLNVKHSMITGDTSEPERYIIFDAFNEPSVRSRVIIATTKTIGLGISLHDEHGGFPRTTFICQRFGIMATHQAAARTIRENALSKSTVHLVYGKHYLQTKDTIIVKEERVISAVNKRSDIASKFHDTGALYPSHYPSYYAPLDNFNHNWRM